MIQINNISKSFTKNKGIRNINLTIEKGTINGLLGPNGSGKTTLIRTLIGDYIPTNGSVKFEGLETRKDRLENIAYMASDIEFPKAILSTVINLFDGYLTDFNNDVMCSLMKKFNLDHNTLYSKLSKGQKKAFYLALTLSRDVDYYILDEPLSGIDPLYRKLIIKEIIQSINTEDKTIIISSHELNEIDSILDTCILLKDGKLEGVYEIDEVRSEDNLYDWFVEKYEGTLNHE